MDDYGRTMLILMAEADIEINERSEFALNLQDPAAIAYKICFLSITEFKLFAFLSIGIVIASLGIRFLIVLQIDMQLIYVKNVGVSDDECNGAGQ